MSSKYFVKIRSHDVSMEQTAKRMVREIRYLNIWSATLNFVILTMLEGEDISTCALHDIRGGVYMWRDLSCVCCWYDGVGAVSEPKIATKTQRPATDLRTVFYASNLPTRKRDSPCTYREQSNTTSNQYRVMVEMLAAVPAIFPFMP